MRAWCAQNGFSEKSYYYWLMLVRKRMLEQAADSTQVQIRPEDLVSASSTEMGSSISGSVVIRFGRACIELPEHTDTESIDSLVKGLNHHD